MISTLFLLLLVNGLRADYGFDRVPLVLDQSLTRAADIRADYLCDNDQLSHYNALASFKGSGAAYMGENLAMGFPNTAELFEAWRSSPAHRAVMVRHEYTLIGIGYGACGNVVLLTADKYN